MSRTGVLPALVLGLLAVACSGKSAPYERLCKIYEEHAQSSTPRDVAAVKITERVERELPDIYEKYVVVVMNPVDGRYAAFQDLARAADQPNWSCDAIRDFYSVQQIEPSVEAAERSR